MLQTNGVDRFGTAHANSIRRELGCGFGSKWVLAESVEVRARDSLSNATEPFSGKQETAVVHFSIGVVRESVGLGAC